MSKIPHGEANRERSESARCKTGETESTASGGVGISAGRAAPLDAVSCQLCVPSCLEPGPYFVLDVCDVNLAVPTSVAYDKIRVSSSIWSYLDRKECFDG